MEHLPPAIASALGFDAAQPFAPITEQPLDPPAVDSGSMPAAALALAALVETQIAHDPYFRAPFTPPPVTATAPSTVSPWGRDPRILLVHTDNPTVTVRGEDAARMVRLSPQEVLVDARQGPFHLCLAVGESRQVLVLSADRVRVLSPEGAAPVAVAPPSEEAVFAGLAPPSWLRETVSRHLVAGTPWDAAVAWGLAVRLAPPTPGTSVFDLLDAPPADADALAWLGAHPGTRARVAADFVQRVDQLLATLPAVEEAVVGDAPEAPEVLRDWLHRRDDLASVYRLLARSGDDATARAALERLDRAVSVRQTLFAMLPPLDDDRLSAVSWHEPDAWWATAPLGR
jgi:hypothetical protein